MLKNRITEQFYSIQGEGRSAGQPAYFIRFAGCNLWCGWCDSMHSVDPKQYQGKTLDIDFSDVPAQCDLVILTGGEPTLFDLPSVKARLVIPGRRFEVESNATVFPAYVNDFHWNLSPKLSSSAQKNAKMDALRLQNLPSWAEYARSHDTVSFKFVVTSPEDLHKILDLVKTYSIPRRSVYLMPEGRTVESQSGERADWIVEACKKEGFNFSLRLHIILWADRRGV